MRVASLDLIRGIAVLGILAINLPGFAGPSIGTLTPNLPSPASPLDEALFAFGFIVFEGKMRALFAMLFGASIALFIDRAEENGRNGDLLQAARLGWLLIFGLLHYFALWWGDILFAYAICGFAVLLLHRLPPRLLASGALALFAVSQADGALAGWPMAHAEEAIRLLHAAPQQVDDYARYRAYISQAVTQETAQYAKGFVAIAATKLREQPFWQIIGVQTGFGEFLPLMMIGVALQRSGFFAGGWPRRTMLTLGIAATIAGLALSLLALSWLWPRHFPVAAMDLALRYAMAPAHLLTALGYAALLVLATPRLGKTAIGHRFVAAGRMAFSNYIGTSLIMTALFYGWGLDLFGQVAPAMQWLFVLFGWGLMLAWSAPWLARFRRGPLEWAWRSLTERKLLVNRR